MCKAHFPLVVTSCMSLVQAISLSDIAAACIPFVYSTELSPSLLCCSNGRLAYVLPSAGVGNLVLDHKQVFIDGEDM